MSSFWVHYLDCRFKCSKSTFNKINKEFEELYDNKDLYQYFSLSYDSKEKKGVLELKDGEVGWHFDDELVDLNSICTKYDTCLTGYYTGEAEGADFRVDINGSLEFILDSAGIDWLLGYTAEEIREIKRYAEDKFGYGNH